MARLVACWSSLPDGPLELVAKALARTQLLACRLVCRSWRRSMTHVLASSPISLDTRCFAPGLPAPSLPADLAPTQVTLRVALTHESKARAWPCEERLLAALEFLADGARSRFQQGLLQLQLPLRCPLPASATDVLAGRFSSLTSLRLVRCSLTQQLAAALAGLSALRRLCIAHANLAALPQLLAAATQLEHLHVHGYHSLVIVEDNAHLHAAWRAAAALVVASASSASASGPASTAASASAAGVPSTPGQTGPPAVARGGVAAAAAAAAAGGGGGTEAWRQQLSASTLLPAEPEPAASVSVGGSGADGGAAVRSDVRAGAGTGGPSGGGPSGGGPSGGGPRGVCAGGRLRCLAVCAAHLYADAVLDETELEFEAEALQWQMRWAAADSGAGLEFRQGGGAGASGGIDGCGSSSGKAADGREAGAACGCVADPHEDPCCQGGRGGGGGGGGSSVYAGGAGGSVALCAGALVGLRCSCCCGPSGSQQQGAQTPATPRRLMPAAAAEAATRAAAASAASVDQDAGWPAAAALAPAGPAVAAAEVGAAAAAAGAAAAPPLVPPPPRTPEEIAVAAATATAALRLGLQLLKSGKREVRLLPPEALAAAVAPPADGQPPPLQWRHLQYVQLALLAGEGDGGDGGDGGGGPDGGWGNGHAAAGTEAANGESHGTAPAPAPPPPPPRPVPPPAPQRLLPAVDCGGAAAAAGAPDSGSPRAAAAAAAAALGGASLAALAELPDLNGLWLDPDEYDADELDLEPGGAVGGLGAHDAMGHDADADTGAGADVAGPGAGRPAAATAGAVAAGPAAVAAPWRWVRVGDVWTRLWLPPPPPPSTPTTAAPGPALGAAAAAAEPPAPAAHAPVQDAVSHAALLASCCCCSSRRHHGRGDITAPGGLWPCCCRLRSLAVGDRRTPFLGVGDDTAAALAALGGLTKLHLAAAYTLPLSAPATTPATALTPVVTQQQQQQQHTSTAAAPPLLPLPLLPPGRLAPLGRLTALQRLSLHFANPLGRPAEVSAAALPTSLVSLALHGVVLRHHTPQQQARVAAAGPAAGVSTVWSARHSDTGDQCHGVHQLQHPHPHPHFHPQPQHVQGPHGPFPPTPVALPPQAAVTVHRHHHNHHHHHHHHHHHQGPQAHHATVATAAVPAVPAVPAAALRHAPSRPEGSACGDPGTAAVLAAGDGGAEGGGGCLPRLRELSLSSSFVEAPSRLGCGGALRVLSLRDSGLGIESDPPQLQLQLQLQPPAGGGCGGGSGRGVGAGDGGVRQWALLLRRWHGLQAVRLVGSSATAAPGVLLPHGGSACVDVHSPLALHVLVRCLPGLRMLALSPPPEPPPPPPPPSTGLPQSQPQPAGGQECGAYHPSGAAVAVATASSSTNGVSSANSSARAGSDAGAEAAALLRLLPTWHLTALGQQDGPRRLPEDGNGAGGGRPGPQPMAPAVAAAAPTAVQVLTRSPAGGNDTPAAEAVTSSADAAAASHGAGGSASGECGAQSAHVGSPPDSWLLQLLRLLAHHSPHLTCLRVAAAADRAAAEAAVQAAAALLPGWLPRLDSLTLTLDLAAAHVAAHPHPEAAARDWAAWLRPQEVALQERMRFTCVSLTPHPNATTRAREVARARLLQQQQHLQQLQQARQLQS